MKKYLMFLFFFLLLNNTLFAAFLINFPIKVKQPNGEIVQLYTTGDEFYHRVHDADGYTIVKDPQTGYLVYAVLKNDELVSSGYFVGKVDPKTVGLIPNINIPAKKMEQIRQNFLKATPAKPNLGSPFGSLRASSNTGTLNNLVIYIRFSDDVQEFQEDRSVFEDFFNKNEPGASLYSYYYDVSNGTLFIPSTFYPNTTGQKVVSYVDNMPRSTFEATFSSDAERAAVEQPMLKRAIDAVKNQIPSDLNLDFDNDGLVDNICFIIEGDPGAWSTLLWPHQWALYSVDAEINGKRVWTYNFQIENHLLYVGNGRQSVLVHEMFHTLGAPDLYRYDDATINPVGPWDVMSANTIPPQSPTAWLKYKYGKWIANIPEITASGTYSINNIWSPTNNCYKIASPNSSTEFFVVEYRDNTNVIWDSQLPGSGLVVYRVNPNLNGDASGPPDEVYAFRPGGTNTTTNGNVNNAYFSSNSGRTTFSDSSDPPAFLSNNTPGLGGIVISDIGASGGATMSFKVTFPIVGKPVAQPATLINSTGFTANWLPSSGATSYILNVYYMNGSSKVYASGFQDKNVGNVISFKVGNLDKNVSTEWFYTIKAVSGGNPSEESDPISVHLTIYDPITCDFASNGQENKEAYCYSWGTNNGYVTGTNVYNVTDFAEYYNYDSQEIIKISGMKMNIAVLGINSLNSTDARIILKVWTKGAQYPDKELYTQEVSFISLHMGENIIDFTSPVYVSGSFFIGYQVFNTTPLNDFGILQTDPPSSNITDNTAYCKRSGIWQPVSNTVGGGNFYMSLHVFPYLCTFYPEWNGSENTLWSNSGNWLAEKVPTPMDLAIIHGSAPNFPDLTTSVTVAAIRFEPGAQIGHQSMLTGNAFVQYDFSNQITQRNRWLMLSIPFGQVYTGDFSFGGYPATYIKSFSSTSNGGGSTTSGSWATVTHTNSDYYSFGDAFVFLLNDDNKANYPSSPDKGLKLLDGIREFPFYQHHAENVPVSERELYEKIDQSHDYNSTSKESKFYSFKLNGDDYIRDNGGTVTTVLRDDNKAYQLAGTNGTSFTSKTIDFKDGIFALIGNPYMATLDYSKFYALNSDYIKPNYYIWTGDGYTIFTPDGNVGPTSATVIISTELLIPPLQGFIVEKQETLNQSSQQGASNIAKAPPGSGDDSGGDTGTTAITLSFNENMTTLAKVALRSSTSVDNKLNIIARTPVAGFNTIIVKRDGGQNEYGDLDARLISNGITDVPEIYTLKPYQGGLIAVGANIINSDDLLIPIGLATNYAGNITLSFNGMDNYDANLSFIDTEANKEIDLTGLASYDYSVNYTPKQVNGAFAPCEDRFFIRISKTITGLNGTAVEKANVFEANGHIQVVSGASNPIKEVAVYNQQGILIFKNSSINAISYSVNRNLPVGAYIVKVISEKDTDNVKVIVK